MRVRSAISVLLLGCSGTSASTEPSRVDGWTDAGTPSGEKPARENENPDAAPSWRTFATLDELLQTCPTSAEIAEMQRDFDIRIDLLPAENAAPCGQGPARLSLYDALRAMRMIEWDEPLPLIGATNPYDWLTTRQISIHVFDGSSTDRSFATETTIHLNAYVLSQDFLRWWVAPAPEATYGLEGIVALLMHEARHTVQGGGIAHDCGNDDSSLALGGAWALQYQFELWMAGHTRLGLLTAHEIDAASWNASLLRSSSFCN